jgi:hypothetical protein
MAEFPVDYDLLDKQVRNRRFREFVYTVFLNPGFVFLVVALGIFAVFVNDAHVLYYSGKIAQEMRYLLVVVSWWGTFICAGVWVVYIRLQEIAFEINRQHAKKE